jgi:hypothetical protein
MTKDEALRLALEALEGADEIDCDMREAIIAIKAALEAKDEPKKMSESWASHGGLWIEDLWKHQEKNT